MKNYKCILILYCLGFFTINLAGQSPQKSVILNKPGLPYIFELNTGESHIFNRDNNGVTIQKEIKLVNVQSYSESNFWFSGKNQPSNFYQFEVELEIENNSVTLFHRPYEMPLTTNGLRIYIENVKQMDESGEYDNLGDMGKDVRISVCLEGEAWGPDNFIFPIDDYVWRSSVYNNTWSSLVPFNLLYYHRGEDYGAIPDYFNVVAPCDGIIKKSPLPDGDGASNAICIQDNSGIEWRLAHMNIETISKEFTEGTEVTAGTYLAKTGMTWSGKKSQKSDPHLHVDISAYGIRLGSFPFLMESYLRKYPDPVFAIAGGYRFTTIGEPIELDAERSFSRNFLPIKNFKWKLSNGELIEKAKTKIVYHKPGIYSEELIVESSEGHQDRDFLYVKVYDPSRNTGFPRGWAYYLPLRGIKPGTEVLFWNRLVNTDSEVKINFGDNDEWYPILTQIKHRYNKAGKYVVTINTVAKEEPATLQMEVTVED